MNEPSQAKNPSEYPSQWSAEDILALRDCKQAPLVFNQMPPVDGAEAAIATMHEMTAAIANMGNAGVSDGSTASYYELPAGATQLQDLISHRNMNAQDGEIFRAIYRKGHCSHSALLREAKKVLFYAQAEVERLERLQGIGEQKVSSAR